MEILKVLLILVEIIACILLIGVVLLQRSKSEGMGGLAMGGAMGEQLFGSRAGNVLTRTTIILACVFMGCTTLLAVIYAHGGREQSIIEQKTAGAPPAAPVQRAAPAPAMPSAPVPAMPVEAAPAAAPVTVTIPTATPAPEAPASDKKP
jgi:preprotein translocase subunit SecG